MMMLGMARGCRELGRGPRLHPGNGGRPGWRGPGRRWASDVDVGNVLLWIRTSHRCQRKCQRKVERIGGKEGRGAHRWHRNRPEMPAAMAESGDEIHRPRFVSSGERKGRKGRASWAFYSRVCLGDGLGFGAWGNRTASRGAVPLGVSGRRWMTTWQVGSTCQRQGEAGRTGSGGEFSWAVGSFWSRAERLPRAFSDFLHSFPFLFLFF
jgi:hypothetical protein